jgi:hypothetical protein
MSGFSANSPGGGESPTMEEPHLLVIPDNNNTHGGESVESAVPAVAIATIGVSSIVPLLPGTALDLPTTPTKNDNDNNIKEDDNSDDDGKGGDDEYVVGEDDDDDDDDDDERKGKKGKKE